MVLLTSSLLVWVDTKAAETLTIGTWAMDADQEKAFNWLSEEFSRQHPHITLQINGKSDKAYKQNITQWLKKGKGPDILLWQGGTRLFQLVERGHLKSLTPLWAQQQYDAAFSTNVKQLITYQNQVYGIPFSYYSWGFYYRKSLFRDLAIQAPKTWSEFITMCRQLKDKGLLPIALGNQSKFLGSAWFSYVLLRLHGEDFYRQLLSKSISPGDPRIKAIFATLKVLTDNQYLSKNTSNKDWFEVVPSLYRKLSGVTLLGNFFAMQIPDNLKADIGFFPFPIVDPKVPIVEHAPLDLFILPSYSNKGAITTKFLTFVADPKVQAHYNKMLHLIPPNKHASLDSAPLSQQGVATLAAADTFVQFIDRDVEADVADPLLDIITAFLDSGNIAQAMADMDDFLGSD